MYINIFSLTTMPIKMYQVLYQILFSVSQFWINCAPSFYTNIAINAYFFNNRPDPLFSGTDKHFILNLFT